MPFVVIIKDFAESVNIIPISEIGRDFIEADLPFFHRGYTPIFN